MPDMKNDAVKGAVKRKQPEGVPFTSVTAKEAQKASIRARNMRTKMRAQILEAAINEGIDQMFIKALKAKDLERMSIIEKALKLTGLDFASSEDAVQKMAVDSKNENNTKLTGSIEFVLPKKKEDA